MWLLYLLLLVVVAALYLIYLAAAVLLAAVFAGVAYALGVLAEYFASFGRVLIVRPARLPPPKKWPQPSGDVDPAILQYFYGPAIADAEHIAAVAYSRCRSLWEEGAKAVAWSFSADSAPVLTAPLGIGGALGMVIGIAAGTLGAIGCALVHLLVVAVASVLARAIRAVVQGADSARLQVKNIRMVCPNCGERMAYPGYVCAGRGCTRRHRDVRPGRLGIIRRYCRCGMRLSTLLLFGSARMAAYCPNCGESLEYRPGEAPEVVLPFIGATGAGKTQLLLSVVTQLQAWTSKELLTAEFGDSATTRELNGAEHILRSGNAPLPTPIQPRSHVIRVTSVRGSRILHMFDAAGKSFENSESTQRLRYLSEARTFILVIDPLAIEAFWRQLPPGRQAELSAARSNPSSPDQVYHHTYQEIAGMGVPLRKTRLAVVFSRGDLIGTPCDDAATWADRELGLSNLVLSARHNFKETRFFRTAAVMTGDGVVHESVATLMRWVLAGDRLGLPKRGKP